MQNQEVVDSGMEDEHDRSIPYYVAGKASTTSTAHPSNGSYCTRHICQNGRSSLSGLGSFRIAYAQRR